MEVSGLPHESRTFELYFTLLGAPSAPTNVQGEFYRFYKGKKKLVAVLTSDNFTPVGDVDGHYSVTVQPDTYGEFFLRAWTSGDASTKDAERSFVVPTPGAG